MNNAPPELAENQVPVKVMTEQRRVFHKGLLISVPTVLAGRRCYRTITNTEVLLSDPLSGVVLMSFPLPLTTFRRKGKFVPSYAKRGINVINAPDHWEKKAERFREEYAKRQVQIPDTLPNLGIVSPFPIEWSPRLWS